MRSTSEVSKLQELRSKTDRGLLEIVGRALEHGLISVKVARAHYNLGERAPADDLLAKAERAYDEFRMLLPLVRGLSRREKTRLEKRRRELREKLDELHECRGGLKQMACCG